MRGDQLARQWQLIQRLARSRAGVGLDQLAEELGCVRRTVYRDLDALMYAGFPVVSEKRDGRVHYRFVESFDLGDVPFTSDEILALAFGADLLRPLEGTVFHDSIASALGKIRASLGEELLGYLDRLAESFRVLPGPHKRYAEFRDTIQRLGEAVVAKQTVSLRYRAGRSGEESRRELDPYHVWYRNGALYVIGHDHRSGEIRTFAVDRIKELAATGRRFVPRADFDFAAYTASSFGVVAEPAVRVVVRFAASHASIVRERTWHASQVVRDTADGGLLLEMQVGGTEELLSWILSFGPGAEVIEPAPLRGAVASSLEGALDLYRR
ncbi:MAG TPA: WYL domain-containing protein [Planctomycetota bacterium]|nr:WYL domain-containing protein [Planctomycetota bacterium]